MATGAIIALIVGALAALAGGAATAYSAAKTNKTNKELAGLQNQWNIEQNAAANFYNTPEQQVMRLKLAGINPALAMSQGIVNTGNSDVARSAELPLQSSVDFSGAANSLTSVAGQFAQLPLQSSQIAVNKSLSNLQDMNAAKIASELPNAEVDRALKNKEIDSLDQEIKTSLEQSRLFMSQKDLVHNQSLQTVVQTADSHMLAIEQQLSHEKGREVSDAQIQEYRANAGKLVSETGKIIEERSFIRAQTSFIWNKVNESALTNQSLHNELIARYGSTPSQIEDTLQKMFETTQKKIESEFKDAKWDATTYRHLLKKIADHYEVITGPQKLVGSMTALGQSGLNVVDALKKL